MMRRPKPRKTRTRADRLYRIVRDFMGTQPSHPDPCLHWAGAATDMLRLWGHQDAEVRAGTATWEVAPGRDGVPADRFGYRFDPETTDHDRVNGQLRLPEMHCWTYLPSTKEIVDLTLVRAITVIDGD